MGIPLTIDAMTLTWIKWRLGAWWRRGRRGPLVLVLLSLALGSGCVPVTRFEEAQSAAQVELEGRRRTEQQLAEVERENAQLRAQTQQQGAALEQRDQELAQAELQSSLQGKRQQDAEGMVEQLRGELARVGGHLQSFQDDKQRLAESRDVDAERWRALARVTRDAALSLSEPIATGEYALDAEALAIVLRVPREKLLADDAGVKPEAEPLLEAVARLLRLHPQLKLRVMDSAAPADAGRVSGIVKALMQKSVAAERFEPLAEADTGAAPTAAQIVLAFALP